MIACKTSDKLDLSTKIKWPEGTDGNAGLVQVGVSGEEKVVACVVKKRLVWALA